jgi:hypothetical protein
MLKIGQKVRCIRAQKSYRTYRAILKKNEIYTVARVSESFTGVPGYFVRVDGIDQTFYSSRFVLADTYSNEKEVDNE